MLAARQDCAAVVDALILQGADTSVRASGGRYQGWTALELGTKYGHMDTAKTLLTAILLRHSLWGCCCPPPTRDQGAAQSPRQVTGENKNEPMEAGESEARRSECPSSGFNPCGFCEATRGTSDCCGVGRTLTLAALNNHSVLVKALLGAAMLGETSLRSTLCSGLPLRAAAQHGHLEVVEQLLGAHMGWAQAFGGVGVNSQDNAGWTPLLSAVEYGHIGIVQYLIDVGGADVDQSDYTGHTPLMAAATFKHKDMVELLIEYGADVKLVDDAGCSASDIAREEGFFDLVELITNSLL
mmetsp:Transcript_25379/g.34957  ORF Transcript_25379/g.34957 Transcript_25379/m.34957 type:complete len:297 (+) Transcript_25379:279-1169(+)